ncbi:MAG TPA: replication initiator [Mycobacterium sp.]|nr:replication initiator [Mycobacterium sp.]
METGRRRGHRRHALGRSSWPPSRWALKTATEGRAIDGIARPSPVYEIASGTRRAVRSTSGQVIGEGYRGHITTKSRRYSITMTALRAARHHWRTRRAGQPEHGDRQSNSDSQQDYSSTPYELSDWRIQGADTVTTANGYWCTPRPDKSACIATWHA